MADLIATRLEEDIVFGVGLGCKGVVEILVEPLVPGGETAGMIAFVENMFRGRQSGAVATIDLPPGDDVLPDRPNAEAVERNCLSCHSSETDRQPRGIFGNG